MGLDYTAQMFRGIEVEEPDEPFDLKYEMDPDSPVEFVMFGSMQCGPTRYFLALKEDFHEISVKYDNDNDVVMVEDIADPTRRNILRVEAIRLGLKIKDEELRTRMSVWVG